jgi:hypothetical protein
MFPYVPLLIVMFHPCFMLIPPYHLCSILYFTLVPPCSTIHLFNFCTTFVPPSLTILTMSSCSMLHLCSTLFHSCFILIHSVVQSLFHLLLHASTTMFPFLSSVHFVLGVEDIYSTYTATPSSYHNAAWRHHTLYTYPALPSLYPTLPPSRSIPPYPPLVLSHPTRPSFYPTIQGNIHHILDALPLLTLHRRAVACRRRWTNGS